MIDILINSHYNNSNEKLNFLGYQYHGIKKYTCNAFRPVNILISKFSERFV